MVILHLKFLKLKHDKPGTKISVPGDPLCPVSSSVPEIDLLIAQKTRTKKKNAIEWLINNSFQLKSNTHQVQLIA